MIQPVSDQPFCGECGVQLRRNPRRKEDICQECKRAREEQRREEKLKQRQDQRGPWSAALSAPPPPPPPKSKRKKGGKKKAAGTKKQTVHPLVMQADMPQTQRDRFDHKVESVPNPHGEVVVRGKVKGHKAVRRVPRFETLYNSKVIDRRVFDVLEWYDEVQSLAASGLVKSCLDNSGTSGGSAQSHIPINFAAMDGRWQLDHARSFIPTDMLPVFDGVMRDGHAFETVGRDCFPSLSVDRARRKASSMFKIAANHLLAGIGHIIPDQHVDEKVA